MNKQQQGIVALLVATLLLEFGSFTKLKTVWTLAFSKTTPQQQQSNSTTWWSGVGAGAGNVLFTGTGGIKGV